MQVKDFKKFTMQQARLKKFTRGVLLVAVFLMGVLATSQYNGLIDRIKSNGVNEYKANKCEEFKDGKAQWLECDVRN